jgi:hypothetical protein
MPGYIIVSPGGNIKRDFGLEFLVIFITHLYNTLRNREQKNKDSHGKKILGIG